MARKGRTENRCIGWLNHNLKGLNKILHIYIKLSFNSCESLLLIHPSGSQDGLRESTRSIPPLACLTLPTFYPCTFMKLQKSHSLLWVPSLELAKRRKSRPQSQRRPTGPPQYPVLITFSQLYPMTPGLLKKIVQHLQLVPGDRQVLITSTARSICYPRETYKCHGKIFFF